MRATPPHLLLTNYAMLEYLLLRPRDMDLFEGAHAGHWRFVVVDEAHVYDGTRGAELAMLLRRLRDRVGGRTDLQCIATSATVGADGEAVARFATSLCSVPFEYDGANPGRQDVVRAERVPTPAGMPWGPLDEDGYSSILASASPAADILAAARHRGCQGDDPGEALARERRVRALRARLSTGPAPLRTLAAALFPDDPRAQARTSDLVELANSTTTAGGAPVLSARYHLFVRATEGAFTCLGERGPHVALTRRERCEQCADAAFEFGACNRCGAVYLSGAFERVGTTTVFRSRRGRDERRVWLALGELVGGSDEDDETLDASRAQDGGPADEQGWEHGAADEPAGLIFHQQSICLRRIHGRPRRRGAHRVSFHIVLHPQTNLLRFTAAEVPDSDPRRIGLISITLTPYGI
jgi:hypothetical protein